MNRILTALCCSVAIGASAQELASNQKPSPAQIITRSKEEIKADEFIYNIYQKTYEGRESTVSDFETSFFDKVENPYPYIYALWFNNAVLGDYGKKRFEHQVKLMDRILADPKAQGTVKAGAYYQKGMHYVFSNDLATGLSIQKNIGSIQEWQYVGPFENISHSGFHKNFGPLDHPESKAEFSSSTNAKIKWFVPSHAIQDGWTALCNHVQVSTGVVYAQSFVTSPADQEVYCSAGGGGALKIWINDALIFSDETERATEFDAYIIRTKLQKGVNRILVQTSFTNNDYPNFSIRFTDKTCQPISGLTASATSRPYVKATSIPAESVQHFAEAFFQEKIDADPKAPLNYLLLGDVYLRNKKLNEAHELLQRAVATQPENNLLRMKFIEILGREGDRTRMLEELSRLRQSDPKALLCLEIDITSDISNQHWEDALQKIDSRISTYGESLEAQAKKLDILIQQRRFQEFVSLAEELYQKYPDNPNINRIMFAIKREVNKDTPGALQIYEKFLQTNYHYGLERDYAQSLVTNGQPDKGNAVIEKIIKSYPYEPNIASEFSSYYFSAKDYTKSEALILEALKLSPYNEAYWSRLGDIKREQQKNNEAIEAYQKSLLYDPNQYQVINKLRLLKGKSESHKLIPAIDVDKLAKEVTGLEAQAADAGYVVLLDERNIVIHPSGAFEEFHNYIVKIINETGIGNFKESSISNGNGKSLMIELAEVIKPSGAHIRAERNDNEVVFTNLEAGDVVVFKYNYKNYITGRFADQFTDKIYFGGDAPIARKRYTLMIPPTKKFTNVWSFSPIQPTVKDVEDFKLYTWEARNLAAVKAEPYMPAWVDIVPVLHISTLAKWQEIANWYSDIANQSSTESYDLKLLITKLFTDEELKSMNQFEKGRRIYEYILNNIRYSSVSFRQGAFVPQPAFITLNTRLGDCKDLSNLYIVLCKMVGIEGRMVLVSMHENGEKDMLVPSVSFDHCIAKVQLDKKEYYIELTSRYLPFTSLPNDIINSTILEIPRKNEAFVSELRILSPPTRAMDIVRTTIAMKPEDTDLVVDVLTSRTGNRASLLRYSYNELSPEKLQQSLEESVAANYKNHVVIEKAGPLTQIDNLVDSASIHYTYRVKDEIAEIGSMRTFKLQYPDVVGLLSHFPANTRRYPVNYNAYEDTDYYETLIRVDLPEGKKFLELPANEAVTFRNMSYKLTFRLVTPTQLEVVRTFSSNRNAIPASEYPAFKVFLEKVVKAEQKMIGFQ